ncbi:MAG: hypothetical protein KF787_07260 [Phycisphaeraceae bacterium]|nr:hypothetical protein [Phycisphaerae bacterium]MBX3392432.1 hypothetical protein [Phycisphaeraceae bacterium]
MTPDQLRTALRELNGERDLTLAFIGMAEHLHIPKAMLIPDEPDHLVKVTDGSSVYIVEAERVVWFKIGLGHVKVKH